MVVKRFKGKTVLVEAQQFYVRRIPWPPGVVAGREPGKYFVYTGEGVKPVVDGDWVITDAQGERHVCPPGIFQATYREVTS